MLTNPERFTGIPEQEHEQPYCPRIESSIPSTQRLLELPLIDEPAPVPVHYLERPDHVRVRSWRKQGLPIIVPWASCWHHLTAPVVELSWEHVARLEAPIWTVDPRVLWQ